MAARYFKATDGARTYFRASPTQVYQSLSVDPTCRKIEFAWTLHRDGRGAFPAVEITRQEYIALTALKTARYKAEGHSYSPAPRDSWVRNEDCAP